ncbi:MAG: hypothetical protein Pg6A_14670 [Termitinemataceae bacterium]|nr:MAG: hypothetical protein Pg6A_14670 [Termitinemataceae bacterium]
MLAALSVVFESCMTSPAVVSFAMPHIIRSDERKLKRNYDNEALRLEAASYNVIYANAFIESSANMLPVSKLKTRDRKLALAKRYYMAGGTLLREWLEKKYPGIPAAKLTKADVPAVYWMAAGELSAYSLDPFDIDLGLRIGQLFSLVKRAYELDPDFNVSSLDEFFISFYAAMPAVFGGDMAKAKAHFAIAEKKTKGESPSPYMSYVESIAIPEQDSAKFDEYLNKVLAVDISKIEGDTAKLAAKLAKKKAAYYIKNKDRFILNL